MMINRRFARDLFLFKKNGNLREEQYCDFIKRQSWSYAWSDTDIPEIINYLKSYIAADTMLEQLHSLADSVQEEGDSDDETPALGI